MKVITEQAAQMLLSSCKGAKIEQRGFARVLLIPTYDVDTDQTTIEERLVTQEAGEGD